MSKMQEYTENLHFVLIYSDPSISRLDSVGGAHMHVMKESALLQKTPSETIPSIPPGTLLQHGTIRDLAGGKFNSGITEEIRRHEIGGDIGIASHSMAIDGKITLNDEAMIVSSAAYFGNYDGKGQPFSPGDRFAFVQAVGLEGSRTLPISTAENLPALVENIQQYIGNNASFAAYFQGKLSLDNLESRTIKGMDNMGEPYTTLKDVWTERRVYKHAPHPDLSHLINFKDLEITSEGIKTVPISRFLIADSRGAETIGGRNYRSAGDAPQEDRAATIIQGKIKPYIVRLKARNQERDITP